MAFKIINPITNRAFELVRDRIALILTEELAQQFVLQPTETVLGTKVFTERHIEPSDEELPLVNVSVATGDYGLLTALSQDGSWIFHIESYTNAVNTLTERGYTTSAKSLQRLTGVIQAILSDSKYRTLNFDTPFIEHVEVQDIKFSSPIKANDSASVLMSRLTFLVRVPDNVEELVFNLIDGYDTSVLIDDSNEGHVFSGNNAPLPSPDAKTILFYFVSIPESDHTRIIKSKEVGTYDLDNPLLVNVASVIFEKNGSPVSGDITFAETDTLKVIPTATDIGLDASIEIST